MPILHIARRCVQLRMGSGASVVAYVKDGISVVDEETIHEAVEGSKISTVSYGGNVRGQRWRI